MQVMPAHPAAHNDRGGGTECLDNGARYGRAGLWCQPSFFADEDDWKRDNPVFVEHD